MLPFFSSWTSGYSSSPSTIKSNSAGGTGDISSGTHTAASAAGVPEAATDMGDYEKRREEIYGPLRSEGTFTWDKLYDKEYALATQVVVPKQELERTRLQTLKSVYGGRLIWGSFLIKGQSLAVVARADDYITDDLAYFVPVCLADE